MPRPLRIEFPGALYHLSSRGDRRAAIYQDDVDRERFLEVLREVVAVYHWICHAYCLMDDHYHLVVETPDANLSKGMRQLNGVYTQASNRRRGRAGPLFEGRFKAILVDGDRYLLELARYVVLNPVRAGVVAAPDGWPWSSYRATVGELSTPACLSVDALLGNFGSRRPRARAAYARFVAEGIGGPSIWEQLRGRVYLGDERFVTQMQKRLQKGSNEEAQISRSQRRSVAASLASIEKQSASRNEAIIKSHSTGVYSYQDIAAHFGIHFTSVGRIVRRARAC
jgi:REP element-mobilizing transposase RayT